MKFYRYSIKDHFIHIAALFCLAVILISCTEKKKLTSPIFNTLESNRTGITFSNKLTPTKEFNLFSYMYYFNGGGIGSADFNNDGLVDLFFSANQVDNKLFLNKGGLTFEDITVAANIPQDGGWSTGVSVIDINNDGLLDIYICKVAHFKSLSGKNQLLICTGIDKNGIPSYKDESSDYGLDFAGYGTQAAFFDYDGDQDLDMFLLNHPVNHDGNYVPRDNFVNTFDSLAGQKIFRNDSFTDASGKASIHFTDVTKITGINGSRIGYGLGVAIADINLDGWSDFYVGNDFHESDYLYINQKNGTFRDENNQQLMHTSQYSMGVDVADVNNDAFPEIISMDMLPYDPYILRRSLADDDYNVFMKKISYGYNYQYARNNLQYNRRNGLFSEIGQYSGVYATDWSWAALWMDFDNDGNKDLFVSNGIPKRLNDIDYINFVSNDEMQKQLREGSVGEKDMALMNKFPEIKIPNQFFNNKGNLIFHDIKDSIGNNKNTFSNGAIYADLDNDGDLDIVVNNINEPALVYENKSNDNKTKSFASIKLKGPDQNINAIGSKIILFANSGIRTYENTPVHGFQSSMVGPILIGLNDTKIDSAFLIWPDNTFQPIEIKENLQTAYVYQKNLPTFDYKNLTGYFKNPSTLMENITAETGLDYKHEENNFNEFDREALLPQMISKEGPALAVADINHDGLDDLFVGASKTFHNAIFLQKPSGKFIRQQQPQMNIDSMWENSDADWVDVNNDNNLDLVIATGGNEYYGTDQHLLPLLYLNDGKGNLSRKQDAFSGIYVTQSVVESFDFNGDGFMDLFIGGRVLPWNYGAIPRSFLLQNDGTGKFIDVTKQYSQDLLQPGMVTNACCFDLNKDGNEDLLLCYQWGGIDAFMNNNGTFSKIQLTTKKGWWNFILPYDIDNDGDIDIIAGNFGTNSKLKASEKEPISLYVNDFDDNGQQEQVLCYFLGGKEIPFATKQELEKQLPYLKKNFLYAKDFASTSLTSLFGKNKIKNAQRLTADYFSNSILINKGDMQFETKALPFETQLSQYRTAVVVNANNDLLPDIMMLGNFYDNNVEIGRNDADFGTILLNKGRNDFESHILNGIQIKGQVRHVASIQLRNQTAYLLAKNNDSLQVIKFKK
jgi:hypothetical protein